jgi:hypothetical protein
MIVNMKNYQRTFKSLIVDYVDNEEQYNFGGIVPAVVLEVPSPTPTPNVTQTQTPTITPTPTFTPTPSTISYLLDIYGSAKVAYSLRKLRASQTNAIQIRRSNDNATQDIGFVGENLDTSAITSFVGLNNAFITKWYDQSGNGNDLTRIIDSTQPRIVSGGTIQVAVNTKPAIFFDGIDDYLTITTNLTATTILTEALVYERGTASTHSIGLGNAFNAQAFLTYWFTDNNIYFRPGTAAGASIAGGTSTGDFLFFSHFSGNSWSLTRNNISLGSVSYTGAGVQLTSFARSGTRYNQSLHQEYILWDNSQLSNQTGIQNNINNYYNVY